MMLTKRNICSV